MKKLGRWLDFTDFGPGFCIPDRLGTGVAYPGQRRLSVSSNNTEESIPCCPFQILGCQDSLI